MDQRAAEMADETEEPENQENNEDSPEHIFSFWVGFLSFVRGTADALKDFQNPSGIFRRHPPVELKQTNYWRPAGEKTRTPVSVNHLIMRIRFLAGFLLLIAFAGATSAAVVLEKKSRQLPYVEVFGCQGVNSFVFRGPTGTSRRPILVPPREYWTAQEAGLYSFVLRYSSGSVRSRLVTPEVFARYQVGQDYYDRPASRDEYETDDSKATQPVVRQRQATGKLRQRQTTAQLRQRSQKRKTYRAAKHRKHKRSHRIAQR